MSADNWTQCPRCWENDKARTVELHKQYSQNKTKLQKSYGKIGYDEYSNLKKAQEELSEKIAIRDSHEPYGITPETMREDYALGIDKYGEFYVRYSAYCERCSFKFNYKFETHTGLNKECEQ